MITDELRASGITVIVIGIGDGTNPTELARMAGGQDNAVKAADFQELISGQFLKTLSTKTCEVGKRNILSYTSIYLFLSRSSLIFHLWFFILLLISSYI